jgi:tRNA A-37 threonylcarbamoyl transferase component Bud32
VAAEPEILRRKLPGGTTVWAQRRYLDALLAAGIGRPLELIRRSEGDVIDDVAKSSITSITLDLHGERMRIAAKEYLPRGGWSAVKNFFRASKALVELRLSAKLLALGVPVPEPVAAVEIRSFRVLKSSCLFTGEIVGGASLLELMDAQEHQNLSRSRLNGIIDALAATIAGAHNKGVFHGDLNASHLILRNWKEAAPEVFLIDFENTRVRDLVGMEERVRDIGRLERSASYFLPARERLRFLRSYLRESAPQENLRDWIGKVKADVARRAR